MKTYLLSAAGVIFLSVIASLLIPDGKLNKSITFVMRMICIFVLIQPVTGIFKISESVSTEEPLYDYEFICSVYSGNQSRQLEELIFTDLDITCESTVDIEFIDGEFTVSGVEVVVGEEDEKNIDGILAYLENLGYINITVYAKSN